jgi:uncharacterized protein YkwD
VLEPHADLQRKAQGWAEHLAATGRLAHSDLRDGTPPGATVAENVGYGSSVDAVHQHLMASSQAPRQHPAHRRDPRRGGGGRQR